MCGRYTLSNPDPAQIRARFGIGGQVPIDRRFNIAPGDEVLAVTSDRDGRARGELLRWGLVPPWTKRGGATLKMINARAETVAERPAYRDAFRRTRCLIIADGFYEWRRRASGQRQPFHIVLADRAPFAFAGLWTVWRHERETVRSCSIITTPARGAVASLHDRMPVILRRADENAWLAPDAPLALLSELIADSEARRAHSRAVNPIVNDARYDAPDCLDEPGSVQATLF